MQHYNTFWTFLVMYNDPFLTCENAGRAPLQELYTLSSNVASFPSSTPPHTHTHTHTHTHMCNFTSEIKIKEGSLGMRLYTSNVATIDIYICLFLTPTVTEHCLYY